MSDHPASINFRMPTRSMGAKLLVVCGLVLLMLVPAFFVSGLVRERSQRARQVSTELGALMGGPQTFVGPMLAIPYVVPPTANGQAPTEGLYIVAPTSADA